MTAQATFAQRFMLEHEWAALCRVTLETRFVLAEQRHSAAFNRLGQVRAAALNRVSFVRIMAIGATDFAFQYRMVMGQLECRAHLRMALEARGGRFSRINDRTALAATLDVKTSRSMA